MKDIKATAMAIGIHCKIALKGLARMIFGTGTTGIQICFLVLLNVHAKTV